MKSKFFRLAILFCSVLIMVSCLLVSPSPGWARQMNGGGGSSPDGGSLREHLERVGIDLGFGMKSGAAEGAAIGGRKGVVPGAIGGGVAKVVEGCSTCHDGSRPDKPGTTEKVTLTRPGWFRSKSRNGGE
jgi:fructose-specific phosphotransferase system IIC component